MRPLLFLLLVLTTSYSWGQESFLKACHSPAAQSLEIQQQLQWFQHLYKTTDCEEIADKISKLQSFTEVIMPYGPILSHSENSWVEEFPYLEVSYEEVNQYLEFTLQKGMKYKDVFDSLELYQDFPNLTHISYISEYSYTYELSLCELIAKFPHLQVITLDPYQLEDQQADECLSHAGIEVILTGFTGFEGPIPKTKIIGIQSFSGHFEMLSPLSHLSYLGVEEVNDHNNGLEALSLLINLTHLSMNTFGISKLEGIKYLHNLNYLNLSCFNPEDESATGCQIRSALKKLDFLSNLTWLEHLNLDNNRITDLSPLQSLENLKILKVRGNEIRSIKSFPSLKGLEYLDLAGNKLKKLSGISFAPNLLFLNLSGNELKSFEELNQLVKLKYLNLSNNSQNADLSTLKLATLKGLSLNGACSGTEIDNGYLTKDSIAQYLDQEKQTDKTLIWDLLKGDFRIPETQIPEGEPSYYSWENVDHKCKTTPFVGNAIDLTRFKNLEILSLKNNQFELLPDIGFLPKLQYLDLERNKIQMLPALSHSNLRVLDLTANQINDLASLSGLTSLHRLDLMINDLTSLPSLSQLPGSLGNLDIEGNKIEDLSLLRNPRYQQMEVMAAGNPVIKDQQHCPLDTTDTNIRSFCDIHLNGYRGEDFD